MFTVTLVLALILPGREEPVVYQQQMATPDECADAVREMASKAAAELKSGGQVQVACVVNVPKSENP